MTQVNKNKKEKLILPRWLGVSWLMLKEVGGKLVEILTLPIISF